MLEWKNSLAFMKTFFFKKEPLFRNDKSEHPPHGALYTPKQLRRLARTVALQHREVTYGKNDRLLEKLKYNNAALRDFNSRTLALKNAPLVPADEWLTDNFYLIEEHIRLALRHFPRKYSRELPCVSKGRFEGLPRIYALVVEFLSHVDFEVEMESLSSFVRAYQTGIKLKIGELWAVPIMLRLALIDNLQRIATNLLQTREERRNANLWLERLKKTAAEQPSKMVTVLAEMERSDIVLSPSFMSEFAQNLSSHNTALHMARNWLEQRLAEENLTAEESIRTESQAQASEQVAVSHSIASLRLLGTADWKGFVESLSVVDAVLREDPAQIYEQADFATRDACRHGVEKLAKRCRATEADVARQAVALAKKAQSREAPERESHVGYYLLGDGIALLEQATGAKPTCGKACEGIVRRFPLTLYLGGIALLTFSGVIAFVTASDLDVSDPRILFLAVLFGLGISQSAIALVNWLIMMLLKPRPLPRLDFPEGVASEYRTMVVVPAMLSGTAAVDELLGTLELHYLGNRDSCVHFALLTDFVDAAQREMPTDKTLLERVRKGISELNGRYAPGRGDRFFLFHRPRLWNPSEGEGVWMGWERKRGKLMDFNAFLCDRSTNALARFSLVEGNVSQLPRIRYVITLDADTQLPPDAARKLIGTMAHPLNRAEIDPGRRAVVKGYGILQPRVASNLLGSRSSLFARIFAGDNGMDTYTRVVSDVYQDLFDEGSFVGKGIYDVRVFEETLAGRLPENRILSHDLLEAAYTRSGLVSDVLLYEEYPDGYDTDVKRRHRWIRGDWQIAQWLFGRVPTQNGELEKNPVSALYKWKIFDNLRRSLVSPALLLFLALSPAFLVQGAWIGLLMVPAAIALPILLNASGEVFRKARDCPVRLHTLEVGRKCGRQLLQVVASLIFLPFEAYFNTDAVIRALYRLFATRRNLLEWQSYADARRASGNRLAAFYRYMGFAPFFSAALAVLLLLHDPAEFLYFLPFLAAWLASPYVAWLLSRPRRIPDVAFGEEQEKLLRHIARRTWHFFETFATEEENWLPPDNFQEYPDPVVASRTSPTNIGLALLAALGATDLGYLPVGGLLRRIRRTLSTVEKLEKFRGHLYNWYDTRTLSPLAPLYVSTVDSGNLAGHLLTLSSGLRELLDAPILSPAMFSGLLDTVRVMRHLAPENGTARNIEKFLEIDRPSRMSDMHVFLKFLSFETEKFLNLLSKNEQEARVWGECLKRLCKEYLEDLACLAPLFTIGKTPGGLPQSWDERIPTLREVAESPQREASQRASGRIKDIEELAEQCDKLAGMDFSFLYDASKKLFVIGYNIAEQRPDTGVYDLLASEARLASYVAIAQGQVPQEHWFALSRLLVVAGGQPVLQSWSGSMFEYLMPLLVMPAYEDTLLDHACKGAVEEQIRYGRRFGVPWGISESAYNHTDAKLNYQYKAFGIPSLGLRRGLSSELVIAPYATVMALMTSPAKACENMQRLSQEGYEGAYGYYEAIDYTPMRLPPNRKSEPIRSFMAHHQGMSLLSLANLMTGNAMQRRFMACPMCQAMSLLLQERISRSVAANAISDDSGFEIEGRHPLDLDISDIMRVFKETENHPEVHLLSNGRYHVMIENSGSGYSRWGDLAVTRWRKDAVCGGGGLFVYVRDLDSGEFWSTAFQPALHAPQGYEAIFTQARAEFRQRCSGIEMHTTICVSPEDDIELRRITFVNRSGTKRRLDLTTYAEIILAPQADDEAHPVFNSLFVQTEFSARRCAVFCTRRPKSGGEKTPCAVHMLAFADTSIPCDISCETDRARFVGRGNSLAGPQALRDSGPLSNGAGAVLDPMAALRRTVAIAPGQSVTIYVALGVAETRRGARALAEKYRNARIAERTFELAWTHSKVVLQQLNTTEAEAQLYGRLAGALIHPNPLRRAPAATLKNNRSGQSNLWRYGIPGDHPIVLLRVRDKDGLVLARQLVAAHAYWHMKGLVAELVILNEDDSVYRSSLYESIVNLVLGGMEASMLDRPGGIFIRRLEEVSHEDVVLLQAVAHIVFDQGRGSIKAQTILPPKSPAHIAELQATHAPPEPEEEALSPRELRFENGLGGFTPDGREYVITLHAGATTPAPWCNVLSGDRLGSVVSESGIAYTWGENAHEFRLTPWSNDPVRDPPGEAFYIRDEETGRFWSPTPQPVRGETSYTVRHGFGYSVFEHTEYGIRSELWVYVSLSEPVKYSVLKLRNLSGRARRISATGYCEWVLADVRSKSLLHIQTETDPRTGALVARNSYRPGYAGESVFFNVGGTDGRTLHCGDRGEFIGRNGSLSFPRAMRLERLPGKTGAGLDPCGAIQASIVLEDKEEREMRFCLGVARNEEERADLASRCKNAEPARLELRKIRQYWDRTLETVSVSTPDPSVDILANGWLLYQTLSSRVRGRSAFYQSGGAFGFRDQLQDVMALLHAEPDLVRSHILMSAGRQFPEGDVQHWWHPPGNSGVRTRISDDYLWLPYATCRYVAYTGDTSILEETVSFIEGRSLRPDEESYYDRPVPSEETATLYEHCVRSVEHGLRFGAHGLPLMGSGDWNDGMNLVGAGGSGESVWLAFFLYDVLTRFTELARLRGDTDFAARCERQAAELKENIERHAWDGEWYRRAYFDDGEPLGSSANAECRIDSLPQSWAAISGAGGTERIRSAMAEVDRQLVSRDEALIRLFTPPFDRSNLDPGYIKGYPPGVRENGGQYTHGAVWTVMAFAMMGENERAWELFDLLNPIRHGDTPDKVERYKVEPYVLAADVYSVFPHAGRGGWTWYTGSAAWMYRLLVETLLGVSRAGKELRLVPRLPAGWDGYKVRYRYGQAVYRIEFVRAVDGEPSLSLDGAKLSDPTRLLLEDDGREHRATLSIGPDNG